MFIRGLFCFTFLSSSFAAAQTDHIYAVGQLENGINAFVLNSESFQRTPASPYPFQPQWFFVGLPFTTSIAVTDPGPFLYVARQNPDHIYSYRRLPTGQLEPLPGSPLEVGPPPHDVGGVWLVKHPSLRILYLTTAIDTIQYYRIREDGSLFEHEDSPYRFSPQIPTPQAMVFTPAGDITFVNTMHEESILSLNVDPKTGTLSDAQPAYNLDVIWQGLAITEDGQFAYATVFPKDQLYGFRVQGRHLIPLDGFPMDLPVDPVFPTIKQGFMALGGNLVHMAAVYKIQEDGSLQAVPGSPIKSQYGQLSYSAFSPRMDRVIFGGNSSMNIFSFGTDGTLAQIENTQIRIDDLFFGISVAPEIHGDPYSLVFNPPLDIGLPSIRIEGDPYTTFFLDINGTCHGPHTTDSAGNIELPIAVLPDQTIEIRVFCDENQPVSQTATVPTLGGIGLFLFIFSLLVAGLFFKSRHGETN